MLPGYRPGDTGSPAPGPVSRRSPPQREPDPGLRQGSAPLPGNRAPAQPEDRGAPLTSSRAPSPRHPAGPRQPGRDVPREVRWGPRQAPSPQDPRSPRKAGSSPAAPGEAARPRTPPPLTPCRLLHADTGDHPLPPSAGLKPRLRGLAGAVPNREPHALSGTRPPKALQPIQSSGSPSTSQ